MQSLDSTPSADFLLRRSSCNASVTSGEVKYRSQRNDLIAFAINPSAKDPTIYGATASGEVFAIRAVNKPGTMGTMVAAPANAQVPALAKSE